MADGVSVGMGPGHPLKGSDAARPAVPPRSPWGAGPYIRAHHGTAEWVVGTDVRPPLPTARFPQRRTAAPREEPS
jgi:hypothetical protein